MRLARPLFDREGMLIAGSGTVLGDSLLRVLRKLAVQSVPVVDTVDLASWETIRPLEQELAELELRFRPETDSAALKLLREAAVRHLARRARRLSPDSTPSSEERPASVGAQTRPPRSGSQ